MEDLKIFSKNQGAMEANDLTHWDTGFWAERLRESKYDINEVGSLSLPPPSLSPSIFSLSAYNVGWF